MKTKRMTYTPRARQADPEALTTKNAPRLQEALANLNGRVQLITKNNTNATFSRVFGVLIGPKSTFTTTYGVGVGLHTYSIIFASNKTATPLKYTSTADGATLSGSITPSGMQHTFNTRSFTQLPSIKIENTSAEAVFLVWGDMFEAKIPSWPAPQEDRLQKLGESIVDRVKAAPNVLGGAAVEFPFNTVSVYGGYCTINGFISTNYADFGTAPEWYITGCSDGRTRSLSLEVAKAGTKTPFVVGNDNDNIPHLGVEAKQNLTSGTVTLRNKGDLSLVAMIRLK